MFIDLKHLCEVGEVNWGCYYQTMYNALSVNLQDKQHYTEVTPTPQEKEKRE